MMTIRKGPQRRQEDMEKDVQRWAAFLLLNKGKLWSAGIFCVTVLTSAGTVAGIRFTATGPRDDIKRLELHQDTLRIDVASLKAERAHNKDLLEFLVYLSCAKVQVTDGYAHAKCTQLQQVQP